MLDTHSRSIYQTRLLDPIMHWPMWRFIHPHLVTLMGCFLGGLIWPVLLYQMTIWAIILLALTGFMDTLDGTLARYFGLESPQGAALDIFCDRVVEFAVLLGLYSYDPENRAMPILFMLGSVLLCITSFLVVGIFSENESDKSFFYSPGLIERTEAFGFFFLMILWPSFFTPLAWLFTILVFFTAIIRLWQFFSYSKLIPVKIKINDD